MGFYGGAMTELSKLMSCILRTRPVPVGLRPTADGFVPLEELAEVIARRPKWAWITADVVRQSAKQDAKGRYELQDALIRATYKRAFDTKPLPSAAAPPELFLGVDRTGAGAAAAQGLAAASDRYLRLEPTADAAAAAAQRHRAEPAVLRVNPAGLDLRGGPDGVIVAERIPAAALSILPDAQAVPLLKAARYRSAYEGALYCPEDGPREEFALRLYTLEPREMVEDDLLAGLNDDMPQVRHRVLSALGIQGKAATQKTAGAIYRSPLAGVRMTRKVFDGLLKAFEDENAPWVAVEIVKAVGEQSYTEELADRRAPALDFLRAAAGSIYGEIADEARGAIRNLGGEDASRPVVARIAAAPL